MNELLVVEYAMIFWMQLQLWSITSYITFARNSGITVWTIKIIEYLYLYKMYAIFVWFSCVLSFNVICMHTLLFKPGD